MFSPLIDELMQALRVLPGVGPKSAQRMAFHLLEQERQGALQLARSLEKAIDGVSYCNGCRTFTEESFCGICRNVKRDGRTVCVVESPADILAFEQSGSYSGHYFVLHGHLSPIDGIGPEDLGIDILESRLAQGEIQELILATGSTVEGEATAHYIAELGRRNEVTVSRLAQGVPLGGELEYLDGGTLAHALNSRRVI
ncbi:recombination mediator RecR [Marinibactrum halimedae]|uniref:Recombination protein RecR n=1 Tax=Marinibactrum halimedae TaxID=1444977 RepID=A0AA37T3E8_9GAMM|nr:recombination mediator RecR [Marinibactrum halimedae]MCD9457870.1 recombination mediator RecR [Marinibactrum halimedae]GLS26309.1 recombination protein RecR [Marinibactrum halimedae]